MYFATNAAYSNADYAYKKRHPKYGETRQLILASVLCGEVYPVPASQTLKKVKLGDLFRDHGCDSVLTTKHQNSEKFRGQETGTRVVVVQRDEQVCPAFLVEYRN